VTFLPPQQSATTVTDEASPSDDTPTTEDRLDRLEAAVFPHVARRQAGEQAEA
jgi:hypothetical protein